MKGDTITQITDREMPDSQVKPGSVDIWAGSSLITIFVLIYSVKLDQSTVEIALLISVIKPLSTMLRNGTPAKSKNI